MSTGKAFKHPLLWIPSSYFAMGTIYTLVTGVTAIMYKNMGLSITEAALYASSMGLPYTIKPLWAPILEMFKTKKFFVVLMQLIIAGVVALAAMSWVEPAKPMIQKHAIVEATKLSMPSAKPASASLTSNTLSGGPNGPGKIGRSSRNRDKTLTGT